MSEIGLMKLDFGGSIIEFDIESSILEFGL